MGIGDLRVIQDIIAVVVVSELPAEFIETVGYLGIHFGFYQQGGFQVGNLYPFYYIIPDMVLSSSCDKERPSVFVWTLPYESIISGK